MKTKKQYLIDLELNPDVSHTDIDIKKQYKKLSLKYHTDKTKDVEKHQLINEAYNSLKNKKFIENFPEEEVSYSYNEGISIEQLHEKLYEFMDKVSLKIDLKKSDFKIIKIDNNYINFDCRKLKGKKYLLINKRKFIRIEK